MLVASRRVALVWFPENIFSSLINISIEVLSAGDQLVSVTVNTPTASSERGMSLAYRKSYFIYFYKILSF